MNFKIIDGDNGYRELLPVFSEMYNDNQIPVATIKEQLSLGQNDYRKLRRDAIEEGLCNPRRKAYKKKLPYKVNPKHIGTQYRGGVEYFKVIKSINGKRVYFGYFKDYRQAERMVELLKENNWDISLRNKLKEQVMMEWKEKKRNTANVVIPGDQEHCQR
jgi:hypothetical protein